MISFNEKSILRVVLFTLLIFAGANLAGAEIAANSDQAGGNLLVTITPQKALTFGAKWRLQEPPDNQWKDSAIKIWGLTPGNYTLEFKDVYGYTKPAASTVRITSGETLTVNAQYVPQVGSLKAWISPSEAITDGGKWQIDGETVWHNSGETVNAVHILQCWIRLKFLETANWNYPMSVLVHMEPNQLTETTLTYTRPQGTIAVDIQPSAARNAGAKWRHRKMGDSAWSEWHDASFVLTGVIQATYQIEFMNLAGWIRPDFAQFPQESDKNAVIPGIYTMNMGSLMVSIDPEAARTAGALWRRAGTNAWLPGGRTINYVPVGEVIIEFFGIPGWDAPPGQNIMIRKDQTVSLGGIYSENRASLKVTLAPQDAIAAGAKWRRVGTLTWHASGETETQVPGGQCHIEFIDVPNWQAPAEKAVTLQKNIMNAFDAAYISTGPLGSLNVHIGPVEAVNAGARWRQKRSDSAAWSAWMAGESTATGLASGTYSVEFNDLAEWQPPAAATAAVSVGQTAYINQVYERKTGSLKVKLLPREMPNLGAKWRRKGSVSWLDGDSVETSKPTGSYTIEFKPVSGWDKPADMPVRIEAGLVNSFQASYIEAIGSLTVTIKPQDAVVAKATWRIAASPLPKPWRLSGSTETRIPAGRQIVQFSAISGWVKPPDQAVTIATGQTASVSGTYTAPPPPVGSLKVTIAPQGAVTAGAKWRVSKTTAWHGSGYKLLNIVNDSFTVEFKDIAGWTKPADQNVTINQGQNIELTGTYTAIAQAQAGSLRVTLHPQEAVDAGAQWKLSDGPAWQAGGATQAEIPIGTKTVEFKDLSGWTKPSAKTVQIRNGQTAALTVTFTKIPQKGSLKVTIDPAQARSAGARWRLGGQTTWRTSGSTLTNIAAGAQTVEFKDIQGWTKPGNQSVQIETGQTATLTVHYTQTSESPNVALIP